MLDKEYQRKIIETGCPVCGAICTGKIYGKGNVDFTSWKCTNLECTKSKEWTGVPFDIE